MNLQLLGSELTSGKQGMMIARVVLRNIDSVLGCRRKGVN